MPTPSAPKTRRRPGASPGSKIALRQALYARHYSAETHKALRNWDLTDMVAEAQLIRVGIDKIAGLLFSQDNPVKESIAMLNVIARASRTLVYLVESQAKRAAGQDPIHDSWLDTLDENEFFGGGGLPE